MARQAVEVYECDRCGKEPAHTWTITGPDGAPREIELCDQHASPIANAYALARPVPKRATRTSQGRGRRRSADTSASQTSPSGKTPVASAPVQDPIEFPIVLPKPDPQPIWR